jgi:hypothetical protein
MKSSKAILICLLSIAFLSSCKHADAATPNWPNEPTSFLHISFGTPLSASVPVCPSTKGPSGYVSYQWAEFKAPCFGDEPMLGFKEVYNLSPFFNVMAREFGSGVQWIGMDFNHEDLNGEHLESVRDSLVAKFGPPQVDRIEEWRTKAGASYQNRVLIWTGKDITVRFDSLGSRVGQGSIEAYTRAYQQKAAEDEKQKTDSLRDKF